MGVQCYGLLDRKGLLTRLKMFILLFAVFLPSINALCLVQSCDKYWSTAKNDPNVKKACAVLFDENCCKLEVWDKGDGQEQAAKEEKKPANAGNLRDDKDRYNRNKLVFTAMGKPHWVEELNDDFDDMDEDIESYRCTCN